MEAFKARQVLVQLQAPLAIFHWVIINAFDLVASLVIALMRCNAIFPLIVFLFASVIQKMHPLWKLQHKDVYIYDAV